MDTILQENNIRLNVHLEDKTAAILLAGKILVDNGYVKEAYIQSMLEREADVSVYIGNHLALPHGLSDSDQYIIRSGISVIQVPEGVCFGENKTAYIIMGIAGKDGAHLEMLGEIALICMEEENVEKLRTAKTSKEIMSILSII